MNKTRLIILAEAVSYIFMWGGVATLFAGIFFFRTFAGPVIIGRMMSVFISLLFIFLKIRLEAKQNYERHEKFITICEDISSYSQMALDACTDKERD